MRMRGRRRKALPGRRSPGTCRPLRPSMTASSTGRSTGAGAIPATPTPIRASMPIWYLVLGLLRVLPRPLGVPHRLGRFLGNVGRPSGRVHHGDTEERAGSRAREPVGRNAALPSSSCGPRLPIPSAHSSSLPLPSVLRVFVVNPLLIPRRLRVRVGVRVGVRVRVRVRGANPRWTTPHGALGRGAGFPRGCS